MTTAMAFLGSKQVKSDPVNETLRNDVCRAGDGSPNLEDDILPRLIKNTSRIHAGFLFSSYAKEALKQLCLRLCSTGRSTHYEGWKGFANGLGFDFTEIEYIENLNNRNDPAYTALQVFVHKRDSTLDKIVLSLRNIERMDIIMKIHDLLENLTDTVISTYGQQNNKLSVILPPFSPSNIPHALQDFQNSSDIASSVLLSANDTFYMRMIENESLQTNANISSREIIRDDVKISVQGKQQYKKIVMLTFASDGVEEAKEVASIFREKTTTHNRIGVLLLDDHAAKVNSNPEEFIFSSFDQVNYVIPIITKGYIKAVLQSNSSYEVNSLLCLDNKYVKFIHSLMNTNYLHDGCLNMKVRCIIPDKLLHLTYDEFMKKKPLFQAWAKLSETKQLKVKILSSKI